MNGFKYACEKYLSSLSIGQLRAYGRRIGVKNSTEMKKDKLIENIIAVFIGEIPPKFSKRGAPVKNKVVDPEIIAKMEELRLLYLSGGAATAKNTSDSFDYAARLQEVKDQEIVLTVEDPRARELEQNGVRTIYRGQLETLNSVPMLLPLNCMDSEEKIIISVELIREYDLREGDVVSCYAEKRQNASALVATEILTINELTVGYFHRGHFDTYTPCYPSRKVNFYDGKRNGTVTAKYLQWLVPLGKGQRGLAVASPKSGKSTLLLEMAKSAAGLNRGMKILVLLVDQSPENVVQFLKYVDKDNLVYTTYEDEPERQVFVAEFILKRAKRYAECGNDVLLLVDSLTALAHAYNDTDASVGGKVLDGGMENKTLQYIKRFFGAARCLERGGSLTIVGALSVDTGNPADNLLRARLSDVSNLEIYLSEDLAKRRIYPAIDLLSSQGKRSGLMQGTREESFDYFLRNSFLPVFGAEGLNELLSEVSSYDILEERAQAKRNGKKK